MRITESHLRRIIRQEIIQSHKLNESLKSEHDSAAAVEFQKKLDDQYRDEMIKYNKKNPDGSESKPNFYMNSFDRMRSPITSNIMRNYAKESHFDLEEEDRITQQEFLQKLPLNEFETYEVNEIKEALNLVDQYNKKKFFGERVKSYR